MNTSLITLSRSIHEVTWLYEALGFASAGDAICLIGDAVAALRSPTMLASFIAKCKRYDVRVTALEVDVVARGIAEVAKGVELIDAGELGALTEQHRRTIAW